MATGRTNKQGGASVSLTGDAVIAEVLNGKTFYNTDPNTKLTGTMTNKVGSATIITPSTVDQTIPQGYYGGAAGDGKVVGDADLIASNIKSGVNIFGVNGSYVPVGANQNFLLSAWSPYSDLTFSTITGSGEVIIRDSVGYYFTLFFGSSLQARGASTPIIDGVTIGIGTVRGYCLNTTQGGYTLKNLFGSLESRANLNITGPGIAYVELISNYRFPIFFRNTLTTNSNATPTIDGISGFLQYGLFGYST